jgi:hypothetical protein
MPIKTEFIGGPATLCLVLLKGGFMTKTSVLLSFAALIAVPVYAAPGDMKISTFLAKADALKAKGIMAMGSSDIALLKSEGKAAGEAYRARIKADKAKNLPAHSCPPTKASVDSDDLLSHFRSYPAAQRQQLSVRSGFADMMKKKYPCKS